MQDRLTIDGVDVHVEGQGPAIVMVHGWPDTYRLWDPQVEHLKAHYRCIRFTLPGFDNSTPHRAHSLAELVVTLRTIARHTCPGEPVTLLLHDWGCVFGYEFAMRHPELVRRIVGVDIGDVGSRAHRQALGARPKLMVFGYQIWLALAWVIGAHVSGALGDRMTRWMARLLRCPADPRLIGAHMNYPYFIQWSGAHGSYRHALRFEPGCPMLYLWGRKKPFQFHSAQWVQALRLRPGCAALELNCGHWLMTARPAEFNRALSDWLAGPTRAESDTLQG
jgi:pimeloyl-ACP methyl ester carboxylesterase